IYFGGLWSGLTIVVDVNNFNSGPNILGKDVYAISIVNNKYPLYSTAYYYNNYIEDMGFKPYGAEGTTGWNDSSQGSSGCSEHIGLETANGLSGAAGAGCSYKYLYEK